MIVNNYEVVISLRKIVQRDKPQLLLPWRCSLIGTKLHFPRVSVGGIWNQEVETPTPFKMKVAPFKNVFILGAYAHFREKNEM